MKPYLLQIFVAVVFGIVAFLVVKKLPGVIDIAFIVAAVVVGWLVAKNNKGLINKVK